MRNMNVIKLSKIDFLRRMLLRWNDPLPLVDHIYAFRYI